MDDEEDGTDITKIQAYRAKLIEATKSPVNPSLKGNDCLSNCPNMVISLPGSADVGPIGVLEAIGDGVYSYPFMQHAWVSTG